MSIPGPRDFPAKGYDPQSENRRTRVLSSTTRFNESINGRLLSSVKHRPIHRILIQLPLRESPPHLALLIMSAVTSRSNFDSVFNSALHAYKMRTNLDLATHPLLSSLQTCDSPDAVLTILREKILASDQSQGGDERLTNWLIPTVNVLYAFSATLGEGVGLVSIGKFPCRECLL